MYLAVFKSSYDIIRPAGETGFLRTTVNLGSMAPNPPFGNLGDPVINSKNYLLPSISSSVIYLRRLRYDCDF